MPSSKRNLSPVCPSSGVFRPVPANEVRLTDGFWYLRQELNTNTLLDHADRWIESMGWYDVFNVAAGLEPKYKLQGKLFTDADVYKLLEAFFWEVSARPNEKWEARIKELSGIIVSAQEEDGYLNTFWGPKGREHRYQDLSHGHELYCAGHLFQAAVARLRSGVEDEFTLMARRFADRICEDFGPDGIQGSDGHPEIEVAMMELYRATGEQRYLDQAKRFVDGRGRQSFDHHPIGPEYYINDMPVREAEVFRGHVVRATYFAAGVVDLAVETKDDELLNAIITQWKNTWARRTYITGGMGSRHLGESYGDDFELPPDRAYTETCGAVGAIMVAWRLLLATGESHYADAIERLLFNMIATHPNAEGNRIFYVNPLLKREPGIVVPDGIAPFRKDTLRANWFWVACCPTNVVRLLSSLSGYFTNLSDDGLVIQQYFSGVVDTALADGRQIGLTVETNYPWESEIKIKVNQSSGSWIMKLRIPAWADDATVSVNGQIQNVESGYLALNREWKSGDEVILNLPMQARALTPDLRINAIRSTTAIERGPLVYCAESIIGDPKSVDLDNFIIKTEVSPEVVSVSGPSDVAYAIRVSGEVSSPQKVDDWPYEGRFDETDRQSAEMMLIPYYAWSNRGLSTMRIWIPVAKK